jgi:hypothetical protein
MMGMKMDNLTKSLNEVVISWFRWICHREKKCQIKKLAYRNCRKLLTNAVQYIKLKD